MAAAIAMAVVACPPTAFGQGTVEAAVAKAEPAIACILVSRSDWYRKLGFARENRGPESLGRLGDFDSRLLDADRVARLPNESLQQYVERQRAIRAMLDLSDPRHAPEAFGSGIVVDAQGLILTNYHVVQDAAKIYVRVPGGKGSYADIWAADPRSDLAVLKLTDDGVRGLTPIVWGNADELRRGQQAIALANPFAAGQRDGQPSVSVGVVSNLGRRVPGRPLAHESNASPLYQFGILIQTDARVALGSSGGALLNARGECVGITTSLAAIAGSDAPGGFAVPVTAAIRKVIEILKRGEEVDYGFFGVQVNDAPGPRGGAAVVHAQDGSPARGDARLNPGDVIVSIGPHAVRDTQDLMLALGWFLAGEKATIGVLRGGVGPEQKVEATLVKYHVQGKKIASSLGNRPYVGGLRVDYSSILAQRPNVATEIPRGVLVVDVQPNSKAARLQIFPGDVIGEVAGAAVATPAEFYDRLARRPEPVELTVRRGPQTLRIPW